MAELSPETIEPVFTNLHPGSPLMVTLDQQGRIVSFNKACEQATGYSFNEVRGRLIWDLFLISEEVDSFKAIYQNLKAGHCSEYNYESCWVMKDGAHRRFAWSSTTLLSNDGTVEYIISTGINVTNDKRWSKALNQHNQRIQLLAKLTLKIRQSLELEEILQTTVTEVQNLLQADRVLIYRLCPDGTGSGVTEAVVSGWATMLGQIFEPEVFPQEYHQLYAQGRIQAIESIEKAGISPCLVEFLQRFGVKAKLVVPILLKEELWGLLVVHQCSSPRQWLDFEIELLKQLADQVSIALAQAQLLEALRQSEERYAIALRGTNDGLWDWNLQTDKVYFAPRWKAMLGYQEHEIGNQLDEWFNRVHPDDSTDLKAAIAAHQSGLTAQFSSEHRVLHQDGTYHWMLYRGQAVRDTSGNACRLAGSMTDITERTAQLIDTNAQLRQEITQRKQAEAALDRREQELKALVENSPDIVTRFDREFRHVYINPAIEQVTGISPQAFIGKTSRELGMPESLVFDWHEAIQRVFNTAENGLIEFDFPTPTGVKSYQSRLVPEYAKDGTVAFVLGVTRDITERKWAEAALQKQAFREQTLNQVIQAIRNSLDLETIFATAVAEVGKFLQVDRVVIVQYLPERKLWLNVADYRQRPDLPVALGVEIPDQGNEIAARLKRKEVILIDDASISNDQINRELAQTYPGAWLLVPLGVGSSVWGSLSFLVENRPYPWQDSEVEFSLAVAEQLAIAIQQAQLLDQSRTATAKAQEHSTQLETEITEHKRTEAALRESEARFRELAQREALLNQLSRQIHRSLELNTILETAVNEIRNLLQIDRCFFLWYQPDAVPPGWEVLQEAKTPTLPSLIGYNVPVTAFDPLTARVFNKEITRVDSPPTLVEPVARQFFSSVDDTALLALPIHTTSGGIGAVSCSHASSARSWRDAEVELLQAVADQLAIAIDQAQLLHQSRTATLTAQEQAAKLEKTLDELQQTQSQLIQSEKMSSLGQLVAGLAHEINNPISFIYGNITYVNQYTKDLLNLIQLYQENYPQSTATIQTLVEELDIEFIREDLPKILSSMRIGADRIRNIVLSLRNFSRVDEAGMNWVNIHEGIDNTLLILAHRLKAKYPEHPDIQIIKDYGNLPRVQCYPEQLNQVFMNILSNAIEAIDEFSKKRSIDDLKKRPGTIWICTEVLTQHNQAIILIGDNGLGMTPAICHRLFDPFFTTKPVGQGTGLGMSISYQIVVEKHQGQVQCISAPDYGAAFLIAIPIKQPLQKLVEPVVIGNG